MYKQFILYFILFAIAGCATKPPEPVKLIGEAQGTYYSIIYYDGDHRNLQPEIDSILKKFDQSVSLWVPNSLISRANNNDTGVVLDEYFIDNFLLAKEISEKTDGAFDFTVGSLVRAWGFGFDADKKVDDQIIDSILQFTGYMNVNLEQDQIEKNDSRTKFDFNAIAQGYSVDLIGEFLEKKNIENYLVDIGGEVRGRGQKPDGSAWKVGIEKPAKNKHDARDLKAIIQLKNRSVATSGSYRKFYEEKGIRYSHTINPKTGYPVNHSLLSVSVMAENTAIADAFATAFLVMGMDKSIEFLQANGELEAFFIYSDKDGHYNTYCTKGFEENIVESFE